MDDAVSLQTDAEGREWVLVHIADPSRWMSKGSVLDQVAIKRASSIYLPELVAHMVPPYAATAAFSLFEKRENLSVSFALRLHATPPRGFKPRRTHTRARGHRDRDPDT